MFVFSYFVVMKVQNRNLTRNCLFPFCTHVRGGREDMTIKGWEIFAI